MRSPVDMPPPTGRSLRRGPRGPVGAAVPAAQPLNPPRPSAGPVLSCCTFAHMHQPEPSPSLPAPAAPVVTKPSRSLESASRRARDSLRPRDLVSSTHRAAIPPTTPCAALVRRPTARGHVPGVRGGAAPPQTRRPARVLIPLQPPETPGSLRPPWPPSVQDCHGHTDTPTHRPPSSARPSFRHVLRRPPPCQTRGAWLRFSAIDHRTHLVVSGPHRRSGPRTRSTLTTTDHGRSTPGVQPTSA